jgi:HD-GYP domain-containing protein (c-di-GMP phosphodiesterase class II)
MLKKIDVKDLRLGMHLHAFEAGWLDHPFWRSSFTVTRAQDLATIQGGAVRECWIDVDKGADVAPPPAPAAAAPVPVLAPTNRPPPAPAAASFDDELRRAAQICQQGKQAVISMFAEARLGHALDAEQCRPLVDEIAQSVYRNPGALVSLARLKTADDYTYMHSVAVCALMVALGRSLGFDQDQCREAGLAGLVHDMGKAMMPAAILNKPAKLTEAEFAVMRMHPERGHELLAESRGVGEVALDVCLHHHERIDGQGYPQRLSGDALSLVARMGAVCDVYDAITSNRPYKSGWDPGESIAQMARWQGHFDAGVFAAFVRSLGIYPIGSLVRLGSQRLAVVVEQNAAVLTTPIVNVFYSVRSQLMLPVERLDLSRGSDRIVGRESRRDWNVPMLEGLWGADAAL